LNYARITHFSDFWLRFGSAYLARRVSFFNRAELPEEEDTFFDVPQSRNPCRDRLMRMGARTPEPDSGEPFRRLDSGALRTGDAHERRIISRL